MFESRDSNPYYQSADLDFDAARAEWERQGEPAGEPEPETHTWRVRKATGGVWHAVTLPVHDAAAERQRGMPDDATSKTACGIAVSASDFWSWGGRYFGGEPLPLCGRCRKAGKVQR